MSFNIFRQVRYKRGCLLIKWKLLHCSSDRVCSVRPATTSQSLSWLDMVCPYLSWSLWGLVMNLSSLIWSNLTKTIHFFQTSRDLHWRPVPPNQTKVWCRVSYMSNLSIHWLILMCLNVTFNANCRIQFFCLIFISDNQELNSYQKSVGDGWWVGGIMDDRWHFYLYCSNRCFFYGKLDKFVWLLGSNY